jgi:hypothetical protein
MYVYLPFSTLKKEGNHSTTASYSPFLRVITLIMAHFTWIPTLVPSSKHLTLNPSPIGEDLKKALFIPLSDWRGVRGEVFTIL